MFERRLRIDFVCVCGMMSRLFRWRCPGWAAHVLARAAEAENCYVMLRVCAVRARAWRVCASQRRVRLARARVSCHVRCVIFNATYPIIVIRTSDVKFL